MGDNKKHSTSRWQRFWNMGNSNYYLKDDALRSGDEEAIRAYNEGAQGKDNPITAQDREDFEEYGTSDPSHRTEQAKEDVGTGTSAIGASKYEIERAKFWDEQTMAARKKAEELLANQPDYTIPESVQGYVGMMTDIGNLLGNITPGGKSGYTIQPYKVKNSPGYGHPTSNEGLAKYVNSFASMVGNATPTSPTDSPTPPSGRDNRRFS